MSADNKKLERFQEWLKTLPNSNQKGDRLMQNLIFTKVLLSDNRGKHGLKQAAKLYAELSGDAVLNEMLADPEGRPLFTETLARTARVYMEACRDDDTYGRRFFQLIKMKREEVADKAANELFNYLLPFWYRYADDELAHLLAWHMVNAYEQVFDTNGEKTAEFMAQNPELRSFLQANPDIARPED